MPNAHNYMPTYIYIPCETFIRKENPVKPPCSTISHMCATTCPRYQIFLFVFFCFVFFFVGPPVSTAPLTATSAGILQPKPVRRSRRKRTNEFVNGILIPFVD